MSRRRFGSVMVLGATVALAAAARAQEAAPADQGELEEVKVTAKFVATGAESAMKQNVRVLDTPVSVENYSDSFMKAIETTNVTDLYSYMTGIQRGGATGYDLSIRGFKTTQSDKNAILVDGLPGLAGRFGSPPTFSTDHVEVVKGPASVLYGQAQPGGFVNLISKKPSAQAAALVDVIGTSYDGSGISLNSDTGYTLDGDITGPFNSAKTLLYRLVVEDVHRDLFRTDTWEHSNYIAPSLTWVVDDNTSATLQAEFRRRKNAYDNFLVAPNKDVHLIPDPRTHYQEPGDVQNEEGRSISFSVSHEFTKSIRWNTGLRSVDGRDTAAGYDQNSTFLLPVAGALPAEWVVQRRARQQGNRRTYNFIDSNVSLAFSTGFINHQVLVGANGGVDTTDFNRIQFFNGPTTGKLARPGPGSINVTVYDPIYGLTPPLSSFPPGPVNDRYTRSAAYAGYFSDLIEFSEHWKGTVGARYTGERQYMAERKTPPLTTNYTSSSKVLPTGGVLYEPTRMQTFYASYSTSYVPEGAGVQDVNGNNSFVPESAHQVEIGSKSDLLEGRLSATAALFDIHRNNTLEPITCNPNVSGTCSQQVGAERSKGGELEVNTHLLETWQALFGYAYTDAYVDRSNSASTAPLVGSRLTNSSLNSLHLWSRYDIHSGPLHGLGVGFGAYYVSAHTGSLPSLGDHRVLVLPGYTVLDVALYYLLLERYSFTLKVGNVLDRQYFEGVNSTTNELGVVPGAPRSVLLSLRVPIY